MFYFGFYVDSMSFLFWFYLGFVWVLVYWCYSDLIGGSISVIVWVFYVGLIFVLFGFYLRSSLGLCWGLCGLYVGSMWVLFGLYAGFMCAQLGFYLGFDLGVVWVRCVFDVGSSVGFLGFSCRLVGLCLGSSCVFVGLDLELMLGSMWVLCGF